MVKGRMGFEALKKKLPHVTSFQRAPFIQAVTFSVLVTNQFLVKHSNFLSKSMQLELLEIFKKEQRIS